MEQQHVAAFLAGSGGPPEMTGEDRRGALLRDMQGFITGRRQVHPQFCPPQFHVINFAKDGSRHMLNTAWEVVRRQPPRTWSTGIEAHNVPANHRLL